MHIFLPSKSRQIARDGGYADEPGTKRENEACLSGQSSTAWSAIFASLCTRCVIRELLIVVVLVFHSLSVTEEGDNIKIESRKSFLFYLQSCKHFSPVEWPLLKLCTVLLYRSTDYLHSLCTNCCSRVVKNCIESTENSLSWPVSQWLDYCGTLSPKGLFVEKLVCSSLTARIL